jgi:hypothetical protein
VNILDDQLRRVTFFTLDFHFYKRELCFARYCLVCMDVKKQEAAEYARRVLHHPEFDTIAHRMGKVIRSSPIGLAVWHLHAEKEEHFNWLE